jgi:hypothetical protein
LQSVCNAIDRTESTTNCETFGHADLRPNGDPECGANCRAKLHTNNHSVCQAHNPANRQTYEIADDNPNGQALDIPYGAADGNAKYESVHSAHFWTNRFESAHGPSDAGANICANRGTVHGSTIRHQRYLFAIQ